MGEFSSWLTLLCRPLAHHRTIGVPHPTLNPLLQLPSPLRWLTSAQGVQSLLKACFHFQTVKYSHLIPAPVGRTSASALLYTHPWIVCQKNKPSTPMPHVARKAKLRSAVMSSMHPFPWNWVAIGCAVVYYVWAAEAYSAGIRYWHCRSPEHS